MKNIVIIGAGDLGKEIVWLIEDVNRIHPTYLILGFLDDDALKARSDFFGYRVLGGTKDLEKLNQRIPFCSVLAIQDGAVRERIVKEHPGYDQWETIVHPTAVIASSSQIGMGCVFFPFTTVSVDTDIENFGLFYIRSTICNDCSIGNYVSVMTGATISEHVKVGNGCFLAAGCCIYPHKKIGDRVNVGVEATVRRDYGGNATINEKGSGLQLFK